MIPGGNLLKLALSIQAKHTVTYFRLTGSTQDAAGYDIDAFAQGVDISTGQVQSVPLNKFELLGLDLAKEYISWFVPDLDVRAVRRDDNGDELNYNGRRYKVVNTNCDWLAQDGWRNVIACDIGPEVPDAMGFGAPNDNLDNGGFAA